MLRTQRPVHQDLEHIGPFTKSENTQRYMRQDLEHSGPFTET